MQKPINCCSSFTIGYRILLTIRSFMQIIDKKKKSWLFCQGTHIFFAVLLAAVFHYSEQVFGAHKWAEW